MKRLHFIILVAAALVADTPESFAGAHGGQAIPGFTLVEVEDLGNGLHTFRYGPYRNIFIVTDEGVIATDPLGPKEAEALRAEISKITDQPVKYVAYSHSHWDHASGGQILKDEGAAFVAQEKCAENIAETPHPDMVPPDITFTDSYSIELGNHSLDLYWYGPSHDNCMVVMVAKPANMLFVVDIGSAPTGWFMEYNPTVSDTHLFNIIPYLKSVEALIKEEGVETIVSGHLSTGFDDDGNMTLHGSTGPAIAISEKREFWEMLFGFVRDEMEAGTSQQDVPDKLLADQKFQDEFVDNFRRGFEPDEMWILLRRVASYVETGR